MNESYTRAPHRRTSQQSGPSPNAALLIDFDNVTMAMRSNLGQELRNFLNSDIVRGKVSVQRAYADWRRYPQYIVPLSEASIDLIFAPAYGSTKKNATDIRLAIDALELVFTRPEIGTYILLSGDSDFSSLVLKLKEFGKYVIGVGLQESTSDLLVQNCDEYYSYNSLSGLTSAEEMDTSSLGPWELVEEAVHRMDDRNDVMRSDRLKQVMLEIDSGFDEKDHGFNKFNRFLGEASSRGLVRLRKIGDGHYEVAPVQREEEKEPPSPPEPIETEETERTARASGGGGGAPAAVRAPDRSAGSPGDGRGAAAADRAERGSRSAPAGGGDASRGGPSATVDAGPLRKAYELLSDVVGDLSDDGAPVRDSEVKREILRRNSGFDEAALGFSKFSRFLRQAYDEGVVELTTDPDGNFHLQPAGAEPVTFEEPEAAEETDADAGEKSEAGEADGRREEPGERPDRPSGERPEAEVAETAESSEPETSGSGVRETEPEAAGAAAPESVEPEESAEPDAGEPERREASAEEEGRPRRRGGLGRFRSGSRRPSAKKESSTDGPAVEVGPVDGGGSEPGGSASPGPDEEETSTASARGGAGGRDRRSRGLGRFRRGQTRSRDADDAESGEGEDGGRVSPGPVDGGPAAGGPAAEGGDGEATAGDEGAGGDTSPADGAPRARADVSVSAGDGQTPPIPEAASDDPVGYMVGNYPGVGRKTAEKLVEAFGDGIFEIIDREPGRLTDVLPEHRAHAVVDARRAERERQTS